MQFNYRELIPEEFDDNSRVWVYQSSRLFAISEAFQIEKMMAEFVSSWNSHQVPVKGYANLFFGQFIVLMADEKASMVSGCSTDSSVRLIKEMERRFQVHMFDRLLMAFYIKEKVQLIPFAQLDFAVTQGYIQPETLYFNNTVQTKKEWKNQWIIAVKDSWLASRVSFPQSMST